MSFDADDVIVANDNMLGESDPRKMKKNVDEICNGLSELENYLEIYASNISSLRMSK
jgi:hypothetical protein